MRVQEILNLRITIHKSNPFFFFLNILRNAKSEVRIEILQEYFMFPDQRWRGHPRCGRTM